MRTFCVFRDSMAPCPLRLPTSIVPQPSKVLPLLIVMVFAPIEPDARTAIRWPELMESSPA